MMSNVAIEAARSGAITSGQFSPLNTGLLMVAIGILSMLLRYQITNRKMTIAVNGEVRQEFIDEMAALRVEVRESRDEIRELRDENTALRREIGELHGVIDGMRRENLAAQHSAQRVVADALPKSPQIERALSALGNVQGDTKS